jgi:cysteine synthase
VALSIIRTAEAAGLLVPYAGDTIYEGTVGSTGISLAAISRARGYTAHICMPNDQAIEKSTLLRFLGATVDPSSPAPIVDPTHYVNRARTLAAQHTADPNIPGRGLFADQFETEANWRAHFEGTGPEIWRQTDGGHLDAFVAGAGTGGTISGVALYLKQQVPNLRDAAAQRRLNRGSKARGKERAEKRKDVKVVLADPQGSGLYNRVRFGVMFAGETEREGRRRRQQVDSLVEGIGVTRVTGNFEAGRPLVDDAVRVTDAQAMRMARWLVKRDGIFVGGSSAVNCVAAVQVAKQLGPGHTIVTILCDQGSRHLSRFWKHAGPVGDGEVDATLEDLLAGGAIVSSSGNGVREGGNIGSVPST